MAAGRAGGARTRAARAWLAPCPNRARRSAKCGKTVSGSRSGMRARTRRAVRVFALRPGASSNEDHRTTLAAPVGKPHSPAMRYVHLGRAGV